MAQPDSKPKRLYTRFISILKIIQYVGFFFVAVLSLLPVFLNRGLVPPLAIVGIVLQAVIGGVIVYLFTQGLIVIVDLLSRIEHNTRPL
jgi:hypothetical protein